MSLTLMLLLTQPINFQFKKSSNFKKRFNSADIQVTFQIKCYFGMAQDSPTL